MSQFYLDIETTGLNPEKDKIISIQLQPLGRFTGRSEGNLVILKEWESSEKEILEKFIELSNIFDEDDFAFIPVGFNLQFEHNFLKTRSKIYNLPEIDILSHPFIDLRSVGILMNGGQFKDSGLDKITGKSSSGKNIPIWYEKKEFDKIIAYIKNETLEFIKFNSWLYEIMPEVHEQFVRDVLEG